MVILMEKIMTEEELKVQEKVGGGEGYGKSR